MRDRAVSARVNPWTVARHLRTVRRVVAGLCAVLGTCAAARAQSADGFNPDANGYVLHLTVPADGKTLVVGAFTMLGGGGTGTEFRKSIGRLSSGSVVDRAGVCQRLGQ